MGATIKTLATKDDLDKVKYGLIEQIESQIGGVRKEITEVRKEISNVRNEMSKNFGESKAETIKWMFVFWIGQAATTLAIVMLFLKK